MIELMKYNIFSSDDINNGFCRNINQQNWTFNEDIQNWFVFKLVKSHIKCQLLD